MGVMVMLLTAYSFTGSAMQADKAAALARDLRDNMMDTYNSAGDMTFEYMLPEYLNGQEYSIELLNKESELVGIIVTSQNGVTAVSGASSFSLPLYDASFGLLKASAERLQYICIIKSGGQLFLEKSRCS
jgi:hypothetical protein